MKKLLSVLLALTLIVSVLVIPTAVVANAENVFTPTLGRYYKFTAENIYKDYGEVNNGTEVEFKGNKFYPYYGPSAGNGAKFSIVNPGSETDLFRVENGTNYTHFIPLNEDGVPFEVEPGHTYTIKLKAYNPRSFNWNQASVGAVTVNTNAAGGYKTGKNAGVLDSGAARTFMSGAGARLENAFTDPTGRSWGLIIPGGNNKNTYIADNIDSYITEYNTTGKIEGWTQSTAGAGYTDDTSFVLNNITSDWSSRAGKITIPANGAYVTTYNGTVNEQGGIEFTLPYLIASSSSSATATSCTETITGNNYLYFNLSGGSATLGGQKMYNTVDFEYIEVYDNAYAYYTYIGENGEQIDYKEVLGGETVKTTIPTAPEGKYFVGWYTDAEFTTLAPVDETAVAGKIVTYYAKFEDYKSSVKTTYGSASPAWAGVKKADVNYTLRKIPYAHMVGEQYYIGVPTAAWLSATYNTDNTFIFNDNDETTNKTCQRENCAICAEKGDNKDHTDDGVVYRRSWSSGKNIFVVNEDGSLFAAKPNTKYKITVEYSHKATPKLTELSGYSPQQYPTENYYGGATMQIGAGIKFNSITEKTNTGNGGMSSESLAQKNNSVGLYDDTNGVKSYSETITTGSFEGQIPALGIYVSLNANDWELNEAGTAWEINTDDSGNISVYSITAEEIVEVTYVYGNDTVTEATVVGGDLMAAPTLGNAHVDGWYTDPECTVPFEGKVTGATTVYGKWTNAAGNFSVTYYNGDTAIKTETVENNGALWNAKGYEGLYFGGWYTDKALTTIYPSMNGEVFDLTLYGKFYETDSDLVMNGFDSTNTTGDDKLDVFYTQGDVVNDEAWKGGYAFYLYDPVTENGNVVFNATAGWQQPGYFILHDVATQETFRPELGATYRIEVDYTVPKFNGTAEIQAGWGLNVGNELPTAPIAVVAEDGTAKITGATSEKQTLSTLVTVPTEYSDNRMNVLAIRAGLNSGTKDLEVRIDVSEIRVVKVTDVVVSGGVSILTGDALEGAGAQAMRVYYGYSLNADGKVMHEGKAYSLVARGIVFSAQLHTAEDLVAGSENEAVYTLEKTEDFDKCWASKTNVDGTTDIVYSNYLIGITDENYDKPISFRGYLTLSDGESEITVYVDELTSCSVNDLA